MFQFLLFNNFFECLFKSKDLVDDRWEMALLFIHHSIDVKIEEPTGVTALRDGGDPWRPNTRDGDPRSPITAGH